jgi:hypothetical protein
MFSFLLTISVFDFCQLLVDVAVINRYTVNYPATRQQLFYLEKACQRRVFLMPVAG